jgi:general stress protein YciG
LKEKEQAAIFETMEMARVRAWYSSDMKKLTVIEFARMGGKARAQKLSAERRREIAAQAGKKGGRPRKVALRQPPHTT